MVRTARRPRCRGKKRKTATRLRPPWRNGPVIAPGCEWEFHAGIAGISNTLVAHDGSSAVGYPKDLPPLQRRALADHMMKLWDLFGNGKTQLPRDMVRQAEMGS